MTFFYAAMPTETTTSTSSDDPCSPSFDCMLNFRTRRRIGSRIDDNGNSFDDCKSKCETALGTTRTRSRSRTTEARSRSRMTGTSSRTAEDCECYCSMFHDPCPEAPPINTGTVHVL